MREEELMDLGSMEPAAIDAETEDVAAQDR